MQSKRRQKIRETLLKHGRRSVAQLAQQMCVTPMTIRRDLAAMEQQGLLTRTHGGCVLQPTVVPELPFADKLGRQRAEKEAIAREVVQRLRPGMAVYLDTGTTAAHVARILPDDPGTQVFTPSLHVALELFDHEQTTVVMYGGQLAGKSLDLVGELAVGRIRDFRLDLAVVGGDALDAETGEFYAADVPTASLSKTAQEQAKEVLVCIDSSKFAKRGVAIAGRLTDKTTLITDSGVSRADRAALRKIRTQTVYTKPDR